MTRMQNEMEKMQRKLNTFSKKVPNFKEEPTNLDHNDLDPAMKKVRVDYNQNLKTQKEEIEDTELENGIAIGKYSFLFKISPPDGTH